MKLAERCARLPASSRRVVALLVAPVCALLVYAMIWLPISDVRASQMQWRTEAIDTLASAKHALEMQQALDQRLSAMRSSPLWSKFYKAPTTAAATTALHADLSTLLSTARASVQSLTPLPSEEEGEFSRIGVTFAASVRLNDLQSLLAGMSAHARYLRVERLVVTAPQTQMSAENPPLAVTMDVYAYQLADRSATPSEQVLSARAEVSK